MAGNVQDGRTPASFWIQADALLRKNLTVQRRNVKQIVSLVVFPALICGLIIGIQLVVNHEFNHPKYKCGCKCIDRHGSGSCQHVCGVQFSNTTRQALACAIPRPQEWPAFLQLPRIQNRVVGSNTPSVVGSPDDACSKGRTCPATILFTGQNKAVAARLRRRMNVNNFPSKWLDLVNPVSRFYLGTDTDPGQTNFLEPALLSNSPIYVILPRCLPNSNFSFSLTMGSNTFQHEVVCYRGLFLWRDNSSVINKDIDQIHKNENILHRILVAYDLLNSNRTNFNVTVWYNSTYNKPNQSPHLLRIARSINMVSDAFLQLFGGTGSSVQIDFLKEMPKPATRITMDASSLLGPLFFAWVIQLLFPVILMSLVYEKQHKLRIMMKMHGLGDGPYWLISYSYFLVFSSLYMMWFAIFCHLIGLKIFQLNNYGIQFTFYFVCLNLQTMFAFMASTQFSKVRTATVVGYVYVFGSGLLGAFLFQMRLEDVSYPRWRVTALETMPGFSLYRGVYELFQYSLDGHYRGTSGMSWKDLSDKENGMKTVLIIMAAEWLIMLPLSYYLDQISFFGKGKKNPLYLIKGLINKLMNPFKISSVGDISRVFVDLEKPDICGERDIVWQLVNKPSRDFPVVCHNLRKVYKGRDGNPEKHAVQNVSLAVPRGECFGLLGPNGSGKTTFINMVTGNLAPTSGTAFIGGLNIQTDMDRIYMRMGICPQYDLIWETLTGREHLLFYARLKNFQGTSLQQVVDQSLKTVNLFGVGDRLAGKYSGGMKRRLSVAISLIGDPQVVYLDEPTTGLDPDSRNYLWNVINQAKKDRAIILTTHSMEEAEYLCDRLGIIVKGNLQCLGSSKELRSRYGGSYLLTVSTDPMQETDIADIVHALSPNAVNVYKVSGTQKFRLPKQEVRLCDVFLAMQTAKESILVHAFGLADSSLEDVFFEVVNETLGITS